MGGISADLSAGGIGGIGAGGGGLGAPAISVASAGATGAAAGRSSSSRTQGIQLPPVGAGFNPQESSEPSELGVDFAESPTGLSDLDVSVPIGGGRVVITARATVGRSRGVPPELELGLLGEPRSRLIQPDPTLEDIRFPRTDVQRAVQSILDALLGRISSSSSAPIPTVETLGTPGGGFETLDFVVPTLLEAAVEEPAPAAPPVGDPSEIFDLFRRLEGVPFSGAFLGGEQERVTGKGIPRGLLLLALLVFLALWLGRARR